MKLITFIVLIFSLASCQNKSHDKKIDRLYFLHTCRDDTTFLKNPSFDTIGLRVVARKDFADHRSGRRFYARIIKLSNEPAPIDGGEIYYLTDDLGIIYKKSTTWPCYTRLHSTNDSIEKRITERLEHILSNQDFLIEGENLYYNGEAIKVTPPR